ncbi:UNKNOWN [Stylonychia lemnae]|uniref:Uncharacterized protein n=1 Tax=Stylonychia lemnae TaxID=5949 RepID=A0A078AIG1_STYLE|nr:UNKNOWN [Stylonychia lemnae]|eukprot:CDW82004.1 UNKNOWN [Stylonychia lemnae]
MSEMMYDDRPSYMSDSGDELSSEDIETFDSYQVLEQIKQSGYNCKRSFKLLQTLAQREEYDLVLEVLWKMKRECDQQTQFFGNMCSDLMNSCNMLENENFVLVEEEPEEEKSSMDQNSSLIIKIDSKGNLLQKRKFPEKGGKELKDLDQRENSNNNASNGNVNNNEMSKKDKQGNKRKAQNLTLSTQNGVYDSQKLKQICHNNGQKRPKLNSQMQSNQIIFKTLKPGKQEENTPVNSNLNGNDKLGVAENNEDCLDEITMSQIQPLNIQKMFDENQNSNLSRISNSSEFIPKFRGRPPMKKQLGGQQVGSNNQTKNEPQSDSDSSIISKNDNSNFNFKKEINNLIKLIQSTNPGLFIQAAMRLQNQQNSQTNRQMMSTLSRGQTRNQNSFEVFSKNIDNIQQTTAVNGIIKYEQNNFFECSDSLFDVKISIEPQQFWKKVDMFFGIIPRKRVLAKLMSFYKVNDEAYRQTLEELGDYIYQDYIGECDIRDQAKLSKKLVKLLLQNDDQLRNEQVEGRKSQKSNDLTKAFKEDLEKNVQEMLHLKQKQQQLLLRQQQQMQSSASPNQFQHQNEDVLSLNNIATNYDDSSNDHEDALDNPDNQINQEKSVVQKSQPLNNIMNKLINMKINQDIKDFDQTSQELNQYPPQWINQEKEKMPIDKQKFMRHINLHGAPKSYKNISEYVRIELEQIELVEPEIVEEIDTPQQDEVSHLIQKLTNETLKIKGLNMIQMKKMKDRVDIMTEGEQQNKPYLKIDLKQKIREVKQLNKKQQTLIRRRDQELQQRNQTGQSTKSTKQNRFQRKPSDKQANFQLDGGYRGDRGDREDKDHHPYSHTNQNTPNNLPPRQEPQNLLFVVNKIANAHNRDISNNNTPGNKSGNNNLSQQSFNKSSFNNNNQSQNTIFAQNQDPVRQVSFNNTASFSNTSMININSNKGQNASPFYSQTNNHNNSNNKSENLSSPEVNSLNESRISLNTTPANNNSNKIIIPFSIPFGDSCNNQIKNESPLKCKESDSDQQQKKQIQDFQVETTPVDAEYQEEGPGNEDADMEEDENQVILEEDEEEPEDAEDDDIKDGSVFVECEDESIEDDQPSFMEIKDEELLQHQVPNNLDHVNQNQQHQQLHLSSQPSLILHQHQSLQQQQSSHYQNHIQQQNHLNLQHHYQQMQQVHLQLHSPQQHMQQHMPQLDYQLGRNIDPSLNMNSNSIQLNHHQVLQQQHNSNTHHHHQFNPILENEDGYHLDNILKDEDPFYLKHFEQQPFDEDFFQQDNSQLF